MIWVYAIVLVVGLCLLIAWVLTHAHAINESKTRLDPDSRIGPMGRRLVGGLVGFGMAGLSAEFSPRGIPWQGSLILALVAGVVLQWWAGRTVAESS